MTLLATLRISVKAVEAVTDDGESAQRECVSGCMKADSEGERCVCCIPIEDGGVRYRAVY